jgi:hypothetical protein
LETPVLNWDASKGEPTGEAKECVSFAYTALRRGMSFNRLSAVSVSAFGVQGYHPALPNSWRSLHDTESTLRLPCFAQPGLGFKV